MPWPPDYSTPPDQGNNFKRHVLGVYGGQGGTTKLSGLPKHTDCKVKLQYSYYWPVVGLFNFSFRAAIGLPEVSTGPPRRPRKMLTVNLIRILTGQSEP